MRNCKNDIKHQLHASGKLSKFLKLSFLGAFLGLSSCGYVNTQNQDKQRSIVPIYEDISYVFADTYINEYLTIYRVRVVDLEQSKIAIDFGYNLPLMTGSNGVPVHVNCSLICQDIVNDVVPLSVGVEELINNQDVYTIGQSFVCDDSSFYVESVYTYLSTNSYNVSIDFYGISIDEDLDDVYNVEGQTLTFYNEIPYELLITGSSAAYQTGYDNGYNDGVSYVLSHLNEYELYTKNQYQTYGLQQYQKGLTDGSHTLSFSAFVTEIFKAPVSMFQTIFNWTLILPNGEQINVLPIMTFLLTIGIALAIVHLIIKVS